MHDDEPRDHWVPAAPPCPDCASLRREVERLREAARTARRLWRAGMTGYEFRVALDAAAGGEGEQ